MLDSQVQSLHSNISLGKQTASHSFICWKLEIVWENKRIWKTSYAWISSKKCQRSKAIIRKCYICNENFILNFKSSSFSETKVIKLKLNKVENIFVKCYWYVLLHNSFNKSWMNSVKGFCFSKKIIKFSPLLHTRYFM